MVEDNGDPLNPASGAYLPGADGDGGTCEPVSLDWLQREAHKLAASKGFYDCDECGGTGDGEAPDSKCPVCLGRRLKWRDPAQMILLAVSELIESYEVLRRGHGYDQSWIGRDGKPEGFQYELADAVIRIADTAQHCGIDLSKAIRIKHKFNQGRGRKHGKRF